MFRPRVIPVLLLKKDGLVKSKGFKDHKYIGDPINAVRIFNDLKADELVFLDIMATSEHRCISLDFVKDVGEEANMPFSVGGGITNLEQIRRIISTGAEKVIINTFAVQNPDFIRHASNEFGSSTITVCMDVKKKKFGSLRTWIVNGTRDTGFAPEEFARLMQEKGAGEIIIQSIDRDGMMGGYDIELIDRISSLVTIPVVALGGAGNLSHLKLAYQKTSLSGLAAGSIFVYHGTHKGVLINYPEKTDLIFSR